MSKNTITKWLLTTNSCKSLEIEKKEVSRFASINRILDKVGYFNLDFISINNKRFLIAYEKEEKYTTKSKILISKIHETEERIIDISNDDYNQVLLIAKKYMNYKNYIN